MLKKILLPVLLTIGMRANSQSIYVSKTNKIVFFAGTPVEDIDATNTKALSFMNISTGEVTIGIPMKEFHFRRSLMEEHFNENYLESEKYPKAEFKGKINDIQKYDLKTKGTYQLTITGTLTIHGVAKQRNLDVKINSADGKIEGETKFTVLLVDHAIERPKILWEKIAEIVEVTATFNYEPYQK